MFSAISTVNDAMPRIGQPKPLETAKAGALRVSNIKGTLSA